MFKHLFASATGIFLILSLAVPQLASADEPAPDANTALTQTDAVEAPGDMLTVEPESDASASTDGAQQPKMMLMAGGNERTPVSDLAQCPAGPSRTSPDWVNDGYPGYNGPNVWASVDGGSSYTPSKLGAWSNLPDMSAHGYWDPGGRKAWSFATGMARVICGAEQNAEIKISMYFVRALMVDPALPESDANAIWDSLEWVHTNRNVDVSMILEGQNSCVVAASGQSCSSPGSGSAPSDIRDVRQQVAERWKSIGDIVYCINGCFNTKRFGTYFYGIEHEKFVTISDTIWPSPNTNDGRPDSTKHPVVISSSGNWARSQIHSYVQDAMYMYDDYKAYREFDQRFDAMDSCANNLCAIPKNPGLAYSALHLGLEGSRGIWASNLVRRPTDAGKGTEVIFSPQRSTDVNAYISQLDSIDCTVDKEVRIAMFSMTDGLAQQMANRLKALKNAGCNVELLMSLPGGGRALSSGVINTLNGAKIPYACTARSMHTKLILFGPKRGGTGSILEGTQNMSVSGQLYSDEHIISIKAQNVQLPNFRADLSEVYGQYLHIFHLLKNVKDDSGRKAHENLCG